MQKELVLKEITNVVQDILKACLTHNSSGDVAITHIAICNVRCTKACNHIVSFKPFLGLQEFLCKLDTLAFPISKLREFYWHVIYCKSDRGSPYNQE
jgi:hypothetical protein